MPSYKIKSSPGSPTLRFTVLPGMVGWTMSAFFMFIPLAFMTIDRYTLQVDGTLEKEVVPILFCGRRRKRTTTPHHVRRAELDSIEGETGHMYRVVLVCHGMQRVPLSSVFQSFDVNEMLLLIHAINSFLRVPPQIVRTRIAFAVADIPLNDTRIADRGHRNRQTAVSTAHRSDRDQLIFADSELMAVGSSRAGRTPLPDLVTVTLGFEDIVVPVQSHAELAVVSQSPRDELESSGSIQSMPNMDLRPESTVDLEPVVLADPISVTPPASSGDQPSIIRSDSTSVDLPNDLSADAVRVEELLVVDVLGAGRDVAAAELGIENNQTGRPLEQSTAEVGTKEFKSQQQMANDSLSCEEVRHRISMTRM